MAKWGSVDYRQIKKLQEKMAEFEEKELQDFCKSVANEIAARLLQMVVDNTQPGRYENTFEYDEQTGKTEKSKKQGGDLRRAWKMYSIIREGDVYTVEIINSMHYASYWEFGHRQEPGRYVPAIGKRLKKSWVLGRFVLTKAETKIDSIMPKLIERRLEKKLRELLDD